MLYSRLQMAVMDSVQIWSEDVQSAYDITKYICMFDDIIVNKIIYVEPCFKFSILRYKSW